jgi:hypothetical protein
MSDKKENRRLDALAALDEALDRVRLYIEFEAGSLERVRMIGLVLELQEARHQFANATQ